MNIAAQYTSPSLNKGLSLFLAGMLGFSAISSPLAAQQDTGGTLVIAHRGASAERPEHTLAAYERAIDQGADYIEPDLVATKDLVLISRHENELSDTTDVAAREEFEDRRREKTVDGQRVAGWFAEDFTLAEIRTLRAKERVPAIRPANARFDGLYQVPTFADIVKLVRAKEAETGRKIGLYPELKHPTFLLEEAGIDMVDLMLKELRDAGVSETDPVYIQSFEVGTLQRLDKRSGFRLVQLVKDEGGPADEPALRYDEMVTPSGLAQIATYAQGIGASLTRVLNPDGSPTGLGVDAKAAGLKLHAFTLRPENAYLPALLRSSGGDAAHGNAAALIALLKAAGVDGIFHDAPALGVKARGE